MYIWIYITIMKLLLEEIDMELDTILTTVVGPFYELNDRAHKLDHAIAVKEQGLEMVDILTTKGYRIKKEEVITAALLHDVRLYEGREDHHLLGYKLLMDEEPFAIWFDEFCSEFRMSKRNIAHAVLEHRAGYRGQYYSPVSEVISSADRGYPNLSGILTRSIKYNNGNKANVLHHMVDKFGKGGYAIYPALYRLCYDERLQEMQATIADPEALSKQYDEVAKTLGYCS